MQNPLKSEPAALAGLVRAIIYVAIAFGAKVTPEQLAAIVVAVELATGIFVRQRVSPVQPKPEVTP